MLLTDSIIDCSSTTSVLELLVDIIKPLTCIIFVNKVQIDAIT